MLRVVTAPEEVITVAQAAEFMRIDFSSDEQETIGVMITAARQWCEKYLFRVIGPQTLELTLEQFPCYGRRSIILPPPVIEVDSLIYLDSNGAEQTLVEGTHFRVALKAEPGEITPIGSWPVALGTADAVRVTFQAGYYAEGSPVDLPKTIRKAMLMQIADLYENREAQGEHALTANPTLERLLSMYRLEMGV